MLLPFEEACLLQLTIAQLTDRLASSYSEVGGINHLGGKNLPSKRVVAAITMDLLRLLFPGFFDQKLMHFSEFKTQTRPPKKLHRTYPPILAGWNSIRHRSGLGQF